MISAGSAAPGRLSPAQRGQVSIAVSDPLMANYPGWCKPRTQITWKGWGTAVKSVTLAVVNPQSNPIYMDAEPGRPQTFIADCATEGDLGRWEADVLAFDGGGHIIASKTIHYVQKGDVRITADAAPEPIRKGGAITVSGTLRRLNVDARPAYVAYPGRKIRLYLCPTSHDPHSAAERR